MIKFKATATIGHKNNGSLAVVREVLYDEEKQNFGAIFDAEKSISEYLVRKVWQNTWKGKAVPPPFNITEGAKGELLIALSWECTMNHRASPRPKAVIAAEKAARNAKWAAKREREEKWRLEHEAKAKIELANLRQRVKHQVDHAFALGNHGTEPAAKYITCQECNAPAEYIGLIAKLSGATAVDEDMLAGVVCKSHNNQYATQKWMEKIPCSRLEFFYDGIRQIAVKAAVKP